MRLRWSNMACHSIWRTPTSWIKARFDNAIAIRSCIVVHEQEVGCMLVPLRDDYGFRCIHQVRLACDVWHAAPDRYTMATSSSTRVRDHVDLSKHVGGHQYGTGWFCSHREQYFGPILQSPPHMSPGPQQTGLAISDHETRTSSVHSKVMKMVFDGLYWHTCPPPLP